MRSVLVLNGPNLNLLGDREPAVYGSQTLKDLMVQVEIRAAQNDIKIHHTQSNSEGALIDSLQECREWASGVVFNPGAYGHYSLALRDAVSAIELPVVEVHLTNVHSREPFRHTSVLSAVCLGVVAGFGGNGYLMALEGLASHLGWLEQN